MTNHACQVCGHIGSDIDFYQHPIHIRDDGSKVMKSGDQWLCYKCGRQGLERQPDQALDTRWESLPETLKAYLAGLVDADGSIVLADRHKNGTHDAGYYDPRVNIHNTDPVLVEWARDTLGAGLLYHDRTYNYKPSDEHDPRRDTNRWKTRYTLVFTNRKARALVHAILPYMVLKRDRAEVLLSYFDHVLPKGCRLRSDEIAARIELAQELRHLNRRGRFTTS